MLNIFKNKKAKKVEEKSVDTNAITMTLLAQNQKLIEEMKKVQNAK